LRGLFVKRLAPAISTYTTKCFPSHDRPANFVQGSAIYENACFKAFRAHLENDTPAALEQPGVA
jgi:hypothetical protein